MKFKNFTLDPFSAAFLARGISWSLGDEKSFDTFNGKSRYLVTLKAVDKVSMVIGGELREAWEIVPTVKNLTNPQKNKKFQSGRIYLSTDKSREVLKIKSKVFVGSVATTLASFQPLNPPQPIRLLSAKRSRRARNS